MTVDAFACLHGRSYTFATIQAWQGSGKINPYFKSDYANAKKVGMGPVDLYAFICNNCGSNDPKTVVETLNSELPSDFDGRIWLDIEPCQSPLCWSLNFTKNMEYVKEVISTAKAHGWKLGIYCSHYAYLAIFGTLTDSSIYELPLWYAHYDNNPSFSDFTPFGGFTKPYAKQYLGTQDICGT
eukprot:CAMPEP_0114589620 /NCGR_PEP_ID=MMETSP0125-20121206/12031_1 /TAXON_ID=485358 ORGANISM="Aristerostoma sp., Strain ATCC 50986" /NCGR_SAMPLE_ID=MMETSP0125 /ASSEMBLY_ACC=CAM_ASM_000245 /LENGTH=182 /DNA_ID=CAMNT_0001786615 /DNA_START=61 /DNA_END=609 /DNA_ORIENTATION=-